MQTERIWTLMSRKLANEATQEELNELTALIKLHPELNIPTQFVTEYCNITANDEHDFLEATFHLLTEKIKQTELPLYTTEPNAGLYNYNQQPKRQYSKKRVLAIIASCILVATATTAYYYNKALASTNNTPIVKSEISTKSGSRSKIKLPDGTTVWLNSNSTLTYNNENFGVQVREVSLVGEAYFDVIENTSKPFIIHTSKMDIKVLGTAFNVKSYINDKTTETTLIRGSVEVTLNDRQEKIMLKPNEKLIFNTDQNKTKKLNATNNELVNKDEPIISLGHVTVYPKDNSIVETAWLQNKLVFKNETLENIALKMERWYGTTILINSESLKKELLTGSFEKESIYQALRALQYTTKFTYTTNANTIIITK